MRGRGGGSEGGGGESERSEGERRKGSERFLQHREYKALSRSCQPYIIPNP